MSDPQGLTEEQRTLVNAAHQAIVISSGLAAVAHATADDEDGGPDERNGAHSRSRVALQAADAAGVPRVVLERTVKAAMSIGREQTGT